MTSRLPRMWLLAAWFLFGMGAALAQPAKRPIDHGDFDGWRSIATPVLSRDGKWLAYSMQPQDGDGELIYRDIATGKEKREAVGALPPPVITPNEENPDAPPPVRAIRVAFTSDGRYLIATTFPTKAEMAAARKAKKKPEEMPKGGLLLIDLASGSATRIANVKSMQVPAKGGAWLAYLKEETKAPEAPKSDDGKPVEGKPSETKGGDLALDDEGDEVDQARRPAAAPASAGAKKEYGTDLVWRDLAKGAERVFSNVTEYSLARDGKTLVYAVSSKAETDNGVYAVSAGEAATPVALIAGKGKYAKLAWDREQSQVAFLASYDDAATKVPAHKVYLWPRTAASATEVVSGATAGVPAGMTVSDKGQLAFSRDGKKLYVGVAPPAKPPRAPDAGPTDEEKVTADLWRWNDDTVQTIQKVRATLERNRTYRGAFDIASARYVQVADPALRTVLLSDDGTRALGQDDAPYRRMVDYDGSYADLYVVDAVSGARKLAAKQVRQSGFGAQQSPWSPDGKWAYYYDKNAWFLINAADGSVKNLTARLGVAVHNEENDLPEPASAYGTAGWTSDSQSLLIYDRYDVWQLFVDGRAPKNLTRGEGRQTQIRFRVQRIEPVEEGEDERGIDPNKALVLRGEHDKTRATGFFRTNFAANAAPQRLSWGDKAYRYIGRALEADVLLVTATRFDLYPDLHLTSSDFAKETKVSDGGAQMAPFLWGSAELMSFKNAKGVPLQAAVYKPANFDPKKKYPLIVYIYEKLSQDVHQFRAPSTGQNINFSVYTSNGYIVMTPDIVYTTGYPGKSAMDAVLPAIDTLAKQGFVDEKSIGIQGHSWGGYQIAYMVTQTNRFRAAEAGAPVGNMTSAYSGIRWGSGLPRQFQYEHSQSRIGKTLQDAPDLFIANSAVFHAKKVQTPLLILANDNDDAVPFYQGIELFLALRRHGKEAFYFNYNGEYHALRRRADQKDFGRRMQQFFDHYLKGAPAPEWMTKGIPYIEREEEKERFASMVSNASASTSASAAGNASSNASAK